MPPCRGRDAPGVSASGAPLARLVGKQTNPGHAAAASLARAAVFDRRQHTALAPPPTRSKVRPHVGTASSRRYERRRPEKTPLYKVVTGDVLWRQASTGTVVQWLLVDAALRQSAWVGGNLDWSVVATEDADGDGRSDIVWRQGSTGVNLVRLMEGSLQGSSTILGGDQNWSILRRPGRQVG